MLLFWNLCWLSFQRQLTYRISMIAGLATNLFFGLLRAAVLVALYGARTEVTGITLQGAITYTGLTQAIIAYLSLFGWYELMNTVVRGDIASDLLKPLNYFTFWLGQDIGRAAAGLSLRGFTLMAAYALIFRISLPASPEQWLGLALTLILAELVSFAWRFLVNLSSFWTPNALGFGRFAFGIALFLSGFMLPLRFFPDWFTRLCALTPFPSMINTVVEVYLGVIKGPEMWLAILAQAGWFIGLALLAQLVMRLGIRTLVIQGG
jgi:ABC-2 type transport system permease protein